MILFIIFYLIPAAIVWYVLRKATIEGIDDWSVDSPRYVGLALVHMLCPVFNTFACIKGMIDVGIFPQSYYDKYPKLSIFKENYAWFLGVKPKK